MGYLNAEDGEAGFLWETWTPWRIKPTEPKGYEIIWLGRCSNVFKRLWQTWISISNQLRSRLGVSESSSGELGFHVFGIKTWKALASGELHVFSKQKKSRPLENLHDQI